LEIFAGIVKIGEFYNQLKEGLRVELTSAILHVLLQSLEAAADGLGPCACVLPDVSEILAVALHQGG
jgi:hypothetical protein